MKKKVVFLFSVMAVFSLVGWLVCTMAGPKQMHKEKETLVVTSFYPVYVMAQNLFAEAEEVQVTNLTENQTGCLHDYQLTARDMKLLAEADVFLMNGAGMELFVESILEEYATLPVIEITEGQTFLEGSTHIHAHEEQEEHVHDHAENGHTWMDVERYRNQVKHTAWELERLFPQYKDAVTSAWERYDGKLSVLLEQQEEVKALTQGRHVVLFHDAFAYLAESLSMEVIGAVALDEETVPSAGEIAELIEEIKYHGEAWILIEEEYASHAEKIVAETGANVIYLNPLVTGDGSADSYIEGMRENYGKLSEEATK